MSDEIEREVALLQSDDQVRDSEIALGTVLPDRRITHTLYNGCWPQKMILILERQSRNGVATIVISLTQISHRVMGLEMEKNTNQKYGR